MSKSVPIRMKPHAATQAFVEAGEEPRASDYRQSRVDRSDTIRITLDLPKSLHRRLKIHMAQEGITIADYLRELLDDNLP